jgi:uncharacterized protein YjbI with pentapeptide repeats
MTLEETLALHAKGKDAWNVWATNLLANHPGEFDPEIEVNNPVHAWEDLATVRFLGSSKNFPHEIVESALGDFTGFIFPGRADFKDLNLNYVSFDKCIFHGDVSFRKTCFRRHSNFFETVFKEWADFRDCLFESTANFGGAVFEKTTVFRGSTFLDSAVFEKTVFKGFVQFGRVKFNGFTVFNEASFDQGSSFNQAELNGASSFTEAYFKETAQFRATQIIGPVDFSFAVFQIAPDFNQAQPSQPLRMDYIKVKGANERGAYAASKYRSLRRLAVQSHDHEREQDFFAKEMLTLRGDPDLWFPNLGFFPCRNTVLKDGSVMIDWFWSQPEKNEKVGTGLYGWKGGDRLWFGLIYQVLSDFGRSFLRPLIWLITLTIVCFVFYLQKNAQIQRLHEPHHTQQCSEISPPESAAILALQKSLVISGLTSAEKREQAIGCLYGWHAPNPANPRQTAPLVPTPVAIIGIVQQLFAITLWFLFGLALRGKFRIR